MFQQIINTCIVTVTFIIAFILTTLEYFLKIIWLRYINHLKDNYEAFWQAYDSKVNPQDEIQIDPDIEIGDMKFDEMLQLELIKSNLSNIGYPQRDITKILIRFYEHMKQHEYDTSFEWGSGIYIIDTANEIKHVTKWKTKKI